VLTCRYPDLPNGPALKAAFRKTAFDSDPTPRWIYRADLKLGRRGSVSTLSECVTVSLQGEAGNVRAHHGACDELVAQPRPRADHRRAFNVHGTRGRESTDGPFFISALPAS
jgi:hypothetical protein